MSTSATTPVKHDELDRRIVVATQGGLPLVPRPYAAVAEQIGVDENLVRERLAAMLASGRIRRIGAVPNHYAIGYTANGMSVWDIEDAVIDARREANRARPSYRRLTLNRKKIARALRTAATVGAVPVGGRGPMIRHPDLKEFAELP